MDRVCGSDESLVRGKYLLLNNLWGARSGSGSQCLWAESEAAGAMGGAGGSEIAWSTDWEWTGPSDAVKSYVCAIVGWHFGLTVPDPGMPVRLSEIGSARSDWDFSLMEKVPGPINVSYDIWLASVAEPQIEDLTDEIMIWVHRGGDATPIGSKQATVTIDGVAWDLWQGPHRRQANLRVHSFVRAANASSASLDLAHFIEHLIAAGLSDSKYLVGIEAGTEVFTGTGRLDTRRYSVDVRRKGG